jgi:DNA-binding response OmpR family regulator
MNLSYPSHSSHFSLFQPAGVSTRILLADDNRTLYRSLVRAGYQVTHAATDTAIWKHLEAHDIELVILNLTMPGVNGLEICQQIRQRSDIPIILLTPNHAETIISGLEVGADDAINHPVVPLELVARVQAMLRSVRRINGGSGFHHRHEEKAVQPKLQHFPAFLSGDLARLTSNCAAEEIYI